jgi:hypothetical protein
MRSRPMPYVSSNASSQFSLGMLSPRGSSVLSEPRTHLSPRTSSQAADPVELIARFTPSPQLTLTRTNYGNRSSKITAVVVATSVSGSGETLAIVEENEYRVYKTGARGPTIKSKCVGMFDETGRYLSGLDRPQARVHGHIMQDRRKREFTCAAVSDNLLAVGASGGIFLLFSIGDGEQSLGKCVFKLERPEHIIHKVLFNAENTELAVFSSKRGSNVETCQFYAVGLFHVVTTQRRSSETGNYLTDCEVTLDMTYRVQDDVYPYTLRDAKFSSDGSRLVACTNHIHGSAMVFLMAKNDLGQWEDWGRDQIVIRGLDNWDNDCLGFTGISLYKSLKIPTDTVIGKYSLMTRSYCP